MAIPTNKEIYDKAVREAANIMSYEQIALNAMFELRQLLMKSKRKPFETALTMDPMNLKHIHEVNIEYFRNGVSLGTYGCPQCSDQKTRDKIARNNNIHSYDQFILDKGRINARMKEGKIFEINGSPWNET